MNVKTGAFVLFCVWAGPANAAEATTIEGGRMELINKGDIILFKGGVTLKRGGDVLKAREMRTTREKDRITAKGNVELFRRISSTQTLEGTGQSGFYNSKDGTGYLERGKKQAHLIYTEAVSSTLTRRMDIYSDRIDFTDKPLHAVATGDVYGTTLDPETLELYEFWADRGEYKGRESQVHLSGDKKSVVRQSKGETYKRITGETIVYNIADEHFIAHGESKAVIVDRKKKNEP